MLCPLAFAAPCWVIVIPSCLPHRHEGPCPKHRPTAARFLDEVSEAVPSDGRERRPPPSTRPSIRWHHWQNDQEPMAQPSGA